MAYLKTNMSEHQPAWWIPLFEYIKDNTIIFMCFGLVWKAIDKVFKYFSDARDAELRKIVHDEMNPTITELTKQIKDLGEAIWALKNKT